MTPVIEPLRQNVPVGRLKAAEDAEIHDRTLRREPLLNVNGKAAALKILEERAEAKHRRRELTFWRATAARIRAVTSPLRPGFDTTVILSNETWAAVEQVAAVHEAMEAARKEPPRPRHEINDPDNYLTESARLMSVFGRVVDEAEHLVVDEAYRQVGLEDLWGIWKEKVHECVLATASTRRFANRQEAERYLALIRWYLAVIPPWRLLAHRCGIPKAGPEFHAWVTNDEDVRTALRIVERRDPFVGRAADDFVREGQFGPGLLLDVLDTLTTVYSRRAVHPGAAGQVLRLFARHGYLDDQTKKVLLTVDPEALDRIYGPDHGARIDTDLDLAPGTGAAVIRHLGTLMKNNEDLRVLVKRVNAQLPVAAIPDLDDNLAWAPGARAVVASLISAGRIKAPQPQATAYIDALRAWWTPRPSAQ
ncbi:hypothetical protein DMB66_18490 [Actinoplanes sp. ATCC 53533]|uniref:hypothetical protein n=1 Tax=Actinoplanes sp. ATCC 53533 TaxID=1288362 RepID=UPI000F776C50|nr:hypothetical protein [Actinoplanes sp. ATCC 53533]RSM64903.1 hypothetical protein DMB66_18490 [Actinoplanes sp. ATCC 53533]